MTESGTDPEALLKCPDCGKPSSVEFRDISVRIGGVTILEHINAAIPKGGCSAIVGPNGAGKTTLVLALLQEVPYTGKILFHHFKETRPKIGYVPQQLTFDRSMPLTVLEFLASFHQTRPLCFGISGSLKKPLKELLEETGCAHLAQRSLGALSGGELQRVMLSAALSRKPELLILDEPASGVDFKGGEVCCELLERFRKKYGFTQLMISHDLSTVAAHATHVLCLNRTIRAFGEPQHVLTDKVLADTFGPHRGIPGIRPAAPHTCHDACCKGGHSHGI